MTKTDKVIGWIGILTCSFELGKTVQDIRINRLKRKLAKQKAERELLEAEKERLEEELRHKKVMADILEKGEREREEQHNEFEAEMERLKSMCKRMCEHEGLKFEEEDFYETMRMVNELTEAYEAQE